MSKMCMSAIDSLAVAGVNDYHSYKASKQQTPVSFSGQYSHWSYSLDSIAAGFIYWAVELTGEYNSP